MNGADFIGPNSGGSGAFIGRREYKRALAKLTALSKTKYGGAGTAGASWDSTGVRVNVVGAAASADEESKKNCGYIVSGNIVTVYQGEISTLSGFKHVAQADTTAIIGTSVCVYVSLDRVSQATAVSWASEDAGYEGRGIPHTDTLFIFPLASFLHSAGTLTLVRRHHHGDMIHAIAPSV